MCDNRVEHFLFLSFFWEIFFYNKSVVGYIHENNNND